MIKIITYSNIDVASAAKIEGRKSDNRVRRLLHSILRLALLSLFFLLFFGGMSKSAYAQEKKAVISSAVLSMKIYCGEVLWLNVTAYNKDAGTSADLYFVVKYGQYSLTSSTQSVGINKNYTWTYSTTSLRAGSYTIYVDLYWNDSGTIRFEDEAGPLTTMVVQLYISNWSPQPQPLSVERGRTIPSTLTVSFNNGGNDIMYGTTVAVSDSKGLAFSPTTQNIGNLVSGASTNFSFSVTAPSSLSVGSYNVSFLVSYSDFEAGLHRETKTATINVTLFTSLSLTNPIIAKLGETITISAKLIDNNGNPLAGQNVTFTIGNQQIGTFSTDSSGNASATYKITLPAATYVISASYSGSSNYGPSYATSNILVIPFTLTITSTLSNAQVISVNGTTYSTDASGKAGIEIDKLGTYIVQIISPYLLGTGTRAVFIQWGDGVTNTTRTVEMNSDQTFSIMTKLQYFLTVNAPTGATTLGQGWYDPMSKVTVSANYVWNLISGQQRSNLVLYCIDYGSKVTVERHGNGSFAVIVFVDSPHNVTFSGVEQYYLEVLGGCSIAFGTSSPANDQWYDSGTSTTISSSYLWNVTVFESRIRLVGWKLDGSALSEVSIKVTGSFTTPPILMSTCHSVRFISTPQYYLNVISQYGETTGSGWYDNGSEVSFSVSLTRIPAGFLAYNVFSGWSGDYSGKNNIASIVVDSPKVITAIWVSDFTQLYLAVGVVGVFMVAIVALVFRRRRAWKKTEPKLRTVE